MQGCETSQKLQWILLFDTGSAARERERERESDGGDSITRLLTNLQQ